MSLEVKGYTTRERRSASSGTTTRSEKGIRRFVYVEMRRPRATFRGLRVSHELLPRIPAEHARRTRLVLSLRRRPLVASTGRPPWRECVSSRYLPERYTCILERRIRWTASLSKRILPDGIQHPNMSVKHGSAIRKLSRNSDHRFTPVTRCTR